MTTSSLSRKKVALATPVILQIAENGEISQVPKPAWTYLLRCADDTLYCGSTTDLIRRVREHNTSDRWARYTSGRRPIELVYSEKYLSLGEALAREYMIKQMSRQVKEVLILGK